MRVSIRKLEKMLQPYWIGGGFSSAYTQYDEYRNKGITIRIDEYDDILYKESLEEAARKLKLIK